jgi:hypothetical protein
VAASPETVALVVASVVGAAVTAASAAVAAAGSAGAVVCAKAAAGISSAEANNIERNVIILSNSGLIGPGRIRIGPGSGLASLAQATRLKTKTESGQVGQAGRQTASR